MTINVWLRLSTTSTSPLGVNNIAQTHTHTETGKMPNLHRALFIRVIMITMCVVM